MSQGLEFSEQSNGLAKITIVQKLLLSIFISCSLYFVYLANCVLALKFVRFSTLLAFGQNIDHNQLLFGK